MSLKVELKPGERMIVGNVLITNSDQRTRLYIDGRTPDPAREGHPLARHRRLAGQAHLSRGAAHVSRADVEALRRDYFALVNDMVAAAPSTVKLIDQINNEILTGSLYKALKAAKKLIQYEQDILLNAAAGGAGLPAGGQADRKPARSRSQSALEIGSRSAAHPRELGRGARRAAPRPELQPPALERVPQLGDAATTTRCRRPSARTSPTSASS